MAHAPSFYHATTASKRSFLVGVLSATLLLTCHPPVHAAGSSSSSLSDLPAAPAADPAPSQQRRHLRRRQRPGRKNIESSSVDERQTALVRRRTAEEGTLIRHSDTIVNSTSTEAGVYSIAPRLILRGGDSSFLHNKDPTELDVSDENDPASTEDQSNSDNVEGTLTPPNTNNQNDADSDGLTNGQEEELGDVDYDKFDTNSDGVSDYHEDADSDGLSNGDEYNVLVDSHPLLEDSDADGLGDYREDQDGDGVSNGQELYVFDEIDPDKYDTDSDGISDYDEIMSQTENDPNTEIVNCSNEFICVQAIDPSECPPGVVIVLPNCLDVQPGELCEGDGECLTNRDLNNCGGIWDVYRKVTCVAADGSAPQPSPITPSPTKSPTTVSPTKQPTRLPTKWPTQFPTRVPTVSPTVKTRPVLPNPTTTPPSSNPTQAPSRVPTEAPTRVPTDAPTTGPTDAPTESPTFAPTDAPTTTAPSPVPTKSPVTSSPTAPPSQSPTVRPSASPTDSPTTTVDPVNPQDAPKDCVPSSTGLEACNTLPPGTYTASAGCNGYYICGSGYTPEIPCGQGQLFDDYHKVCALESIVMASSGCNACP